MTPPVCGATLCSVWECETYPPLVPVWLTSCCRPLIWTQDNPFVTGSWPGRQLGQLALQWMLWNGLCAKQISSCANRASSWWNLSRFPSWKLNAWTLLNTTKSEHSEMCPRVLCSIERLFDELSESACSALDPLQVSKSGILTVNAECRRDAKSLFALVYIHRFVSSLLSTTVKIIYIDKGITTWWSKNHTYFLFFLYYYKNTMLDSITYASFEWYLVLAL